MAATALPLPRATPRFNEDLRVRHRKHVEPPIEVNFSEAQPTCNADVRHAQSRLRTGHFIETVHWHREVRSTLPDSPHRDATTGRAVIRPRFAWGTSTNRTAGRWTKRWCRPRFGNDAVVESLC